MMVSSRVGLGVTSVALALIGATSASAQSESLIQDQLDGVRNRLFELGPFHATPVIRFATGYDSNALSTPDPQQDISALFGPGIQLGLPFGSSAFFDFYQEVDFVYYQEQVELRQVFSITRVGGGWGGRRFLFQVHDEFRDETQRPTSEFDFPVETRTNLFDASLTMTLGWRQELSARYRQQKSEIREQLIDDPLVPQRLNNVRDSISLDLARHVTAKTQAIVEGFFEKQTFDDPTRDNDSYGARAGFDFSPGSGRASLPAKEEAGISGRVMIGFRKIVPVVVTQLGYTGPIGIADVRLTSAGRHRLRGVYDREIVPSILSDNWYFVQNRVGAFFRWQLHEKFSIEPGAIVGDNNYPLPRLVEGDDGELVEEEIVDEHLSLQLNLEYNLRKSWFVGVTTQYFERRSNVVAFDKGRTLVNLNLILRP
jgi:hypothetical protein